MNVLEIVTRLLSRFRYPVSLPEDIAKDLGLHLSNSLSFDEFIRQLVSANELPKKLKRFMSRLQAEAAFQSALKKEIFGRSSLFSYYFNEGWLVMALYFDEEEKLRRVCLQCPKDKSLDGVDLPLEEEAATSTLVLT